MKIKFQKFKDGHNMWSRQSNVNDRKLKTKKNWSLCIFIEKKNLKREESNKHAGALMCIHAIQKKLLTLWRLKKSEENF